MTSTKRHLSIILMLVVYVFTMFSSLFIFLATNNAKTIKADTVENAYYYNNLTLKDTKGNDTEYTLAKKFYQVLNSLKQSGAFKKGVVSYALDGILSSSQIKAWVVDGNLEIPKAFGAARDSFLMDNPELFYIDMYKLTVSAELKNGVYSAVIDTGRQNDAYRTDTFKTEAQVNEAITKFNSEVQSIISKATAQVEDLPESEKDRNLAVAVNEIIASAVNYDFATLENAKDDANSVSVSNMTFSAYGALVNKLAVCSGYSMAYKAVLDALNIPCVVVSGYSKGKDQNGDDTEGNIGHSWNYVYLKTAAKDSVLENTPSVSNALFANENEAGAWFAFDTTWNSVRSDKNTYTVMDAFTASKTLIPDGTISSSKYVLKYPALSSVSYFFACNPNAESEVNDAEFSYSNIVGNSSGEQSKVYVSYKNKGASQLFNEDNLRIAVRNYIISGDDGEKMWTKWQDLETSERLNDLGHIELGISNQVSSTLVRLSYNIERTQYVVLTGIEPTEDVLFPNGQLAYEKLNYAYDEFPQANVVYISDEFENYSYGKYIPAPYIDNVKSSPNAGTHIIINDNMRESETSNVMADKNAIYIKLVYDEPLHILDSSKPLEIEFTPEKEDARGYSSFAKFDDGKYIHLISDENGVMNTLEFKFKPSLMYSHNEYNYRFDFKNIGSAKIVEKDVDGKLVRTTSDKAPNSAYYTVSRIYYTCSRVFGDGRLWIDCCAQPTLVDNSDLSADNFKDEFGNTTFNEKERSQMMLVVNNTSSEVKNAMLNEIDEKSDININKNDIITSQTFDINLQICGHTKQIPDGSYVKIALGFPEGYGPDDEGVTFKIFHRKHISGDNYVIEEIPCVVTQFGIVASVTSFSPYMIAVVPANKAIGKTIYASVNGNGGKLNKADGQIKTVNEGGSCEYTITAEEGYQLHKLMLNGREIDIQSRVSADNKITFSYAELESNNELEIQFIENGAVERFNNGSFVEPKKVVVSVEEQENMFVAPEPSTPNIPDNTENTNQPSTINVGIVVFFVVAIVVVVIAFVVAIIYRKRKSISK